MPERPEISEEEIFGDALTDFRQVMAYRGQHTAPFDPEEDVPFYELDGHAPDFYDHPEWYSRPSDASDSQSLKAIFAARGNPNYPVTIYRASPVNEFNTGDWVTPSLEYATIHAVGNMGPDTGRTSIHSTTVPASQLLWDANSVNEFGYVGPPMQGEVVVAAGDQRLSMQQKAAAWDKSSIDLSPAEQEHVGAFDPNQWEKRRPDGGLVRQVDPEMSEDRQRVNRLAYCPLDHLALDEFHNGWDTWCPRCAIVYRERGSTFPINDRGLIDAIYQEVENLRQGPWRTWRDLEDPSDDPYRQASALDQYQEVSPAEQRAILRHATHIEGAFNPHQFEDKSKEPQSQTYIDLWSLAQEEEGLSYRSVGPSPRISDTRCPECGGYADDIEGDLHVCEDCDWSGIDPVTLHEKWNERDYLEEEDPYRQASALPHQRGAKVEPKVEPEGEATSGFKTTTVLGNQIINVGDEFTEVVSAFDRSQWADPDPWAVPIPRSNPTAEELEKARQKAQERIEANRESMAEINRQYPVDFDEVYAEELQKVQTWIDLGGAGAERSWEEFYDPRATRQAAFDPTQFSGPDRQPQGLFNSFVATCPKCGSQALQEPHDVFKGRDQIGCPECKDYWLVDDPRQEWPMSNPDDIRGMIQLLTEYPEVFEPKLPKQTAFDPKGFENNAYPNAQHGQVRWDMGEDFVRPSDDDDLDAHPFCPECGSGTVQYDYEDYADEPTGLYCLNCDHEWPPEAEQIIWKNRREPWYDEDNQFIPHEGAFDAETWEERKRPDPDEQIHAFEPDLSGYKVIECPYCGSNKALTNVDGLPWVWCLDEKKTYTDSGLGMPMAQSSIDSNTKVYNAVVDPTWYGRDYRTDGSGRWEKQTAFDPDNWAEQEGNKDEALWEDHPGHTLTICPEGHTAILEDIYPATRTSMVGCPECGSQWLYEDNEWRRRGNYSLDGIARMRQRIDLMRESAFDPKKFEPKTDHQDAQERQVQWDVNFTYNDYPEGLQPHPFCPFCGEDAMVEVDPEDRKKMYCNYCGEGWPRDAELTLWKKDTRTAMAVDPKWWEEYTERTPHAYHGTDSWNADSIAMHGLVPDSASQYDGRLAPSPEHVYMTTEPQEAIWHSENHDDPEVVSIDLSQLDPALVEADEDWAANNVENYGLRDFATWMTETPDEYGRANWYHNYERPEDDRQISQDSVENGSFAYRGVVPPLAISKSTSKSTPGLQVYRSNQLSAASQSQIDSCKSPEPYTPKLSPHPKAAAFDPNQWAGQPEATDRLLKPDRHDGISAFECPHCGGEAITDGNRIWCLDEETTFNRDGVKLKEGWGEDAISDNRRIYDELKDMPWVGRDPDTDAIRWKLASFDPDEWQSRTPGEAEGQLFSNEDQGDAMLREDLESYAICPHCGGHNIYYTTLLGQGDQWRAVCEDCEAEGGSPEHCSWPEDEMVWEWKKPPTY